MRLLYLRVAFDFEIHQLKVKISSDSDRILIWPWQVTAAVCIEPSEDDKVLPILSLAAHPAIFKVPELQKKVLLETQQHAQCLIYPP